MRRPIIPISLRNKDASIRTEALVDSGADRCWFAYEVGTALGIEVEKGLKETVYGFTGHQCDYFLHTIDLNVGGWEHAIEVGFLAKDSNAPYGVLGQSGFFDLYIVTFDVIKYEIELKERNQVKRSSLPRRA